MTRVSVTIWSGLVVSILTLGCGQGQAPAAGNAVPAATSTEGVTIDFSSEPDPPKSGDNTIEVTVRQPDGTAITDAMVTAVFSMPAMPAMMRPGFGLPNLRRNVCPHFYMTGSRGAIPIQAPHLLKALIRQDTNTSRCQLRGGVHMEQGYVNDVCLTPRFNQCVFYEEDLTGE